MPTDPSNVPQHVVDESMHHYWPPGVSMEAHRKNMRRSIAAALDALFTDEAVRVPSCHPRFQDFGGAVTHARPSDVLAAVLEHQA